MISLRLAPLVDDFPLAFELAEATSRCFMDDSRQPPAHTCRQKEHEEDDQQPYPHPRLIIFPCEPNQCIHQLVVGGLWGSACKILCA